MNLNYRLINKTREQVKEILGEPDLFSATSRKIKHPLIYKYNDTEFYFMSEKDGKCYYIKERSSLIVIDNVSIQKIVEYHAADE